MKFDYKLNVNDYVAVVEAIADGYFNNVGEYSPQMGRIVAVAVFCDYCMKESVFGDVENPDMDVIFDNNEIMKQVFEIDFDISIHFPFESAD